MVLVPEEVRCAVCKSIFCCLECRNRHEQNDHNPNDVWAERNRQQCGFCQGYPTMEFQSRNDFALIMHLCQTHLPLHCKKCLTQFNAIEDFSATNKCSHLNDVCSLQSPKNCSNIKMENQLSNNKDVSNINYITAVQKSSFEKSMDSDSVISLRNYSTILHTSNHPLYKTQSPDAMENVLVRQTSTPMHDHLMMIKSSDSNEQSCGSCLVSSSSGQISSINSDSSSDTSINTFAKPNEFRTNAQQQSIVVTQKKTTTFKRPRNLLTMTPLTRQVMTKSIHRAILEYSSQTGTGSSPKSPLDLRVRTSLHRDPKNMSIRTPPKVSKHFGKSSKICDTKHTPSSSLMKTNSNSKLSPLETVYEQEKDANKTSNDGDDHETCVSTNNQHNGLSNDNQAIFSGNNDGIATSSEPIVETPVLVSRKFSAEKITTSDQFDGDIWFTPREIVESNVFENIEIYTPKLPKKRTNGRRVDDDEHSKETTNDIEFENMSKGSLNKTSGSKLWSFVSTVLRFASLAPKSDLSVDDLNENDDESHVIIKRCASYTGILCEKNTSDEESENDPLQPIKRRRITSIDTAMERAAMNYRKRIMCRPPIRRMLNNNSQ